MILYFQIWMYSEIMMFSDRFTQARSFLTGLHKLEVFWQVYTNSKFSDRFTQARSFLTGLHKLKVFWQVYTRSLDKFYIQTCSCYWPCNVTMFYSLLWSLNGKLCFFIFQYKYNNSIPFFLLLIDLVYFVVTGTSIESVVNCAFICFYISWI
jgi:hypothetical protein